MDVKELINHAPKQVTPYFDIRIYPKGSSILVPDAKNSSLYLLLEGTAEVYQDVYKRQLGMILAVHPDDVDKTMEAIRAAGEAPYVVGSVESGEKGVALC